MKQNKVKDNMKTKKANKLCIFTIFILICILIYLGYVFICKTYIYPTRYKSYVLGAAARYNVDPYLIFSIIKQESKFNKNACSNKNAKGLMQLLDSTAEEMAVDMGEIPSTNLDLFDSKINIYVGTKYFRTLIDRYDGNIYLAICAYNAGLGNVDKWKLSKEIYSDSKVNISNIPFEETKEYLVNIINYYNKYVNLYSAN